VAIVYLLLNFFRCLRFKSLLNRDEIDLPTLFPISLYHNFLVRILPFKLGEVWYVVLMRRYFGVSVEEGVGSLFASRMLELLVIVIVGTAALLTSGTVLAGQSALQALFLIIILAAVPLLYFAGLILRAMAVVIQRAPIALVNKAAVRVDSMAREFDRLRHPRVFLVGLFWSIFTYGCSFAANAILLAATGIQLQPSMLILAITLSMFASAFPFNVAGFGMVEMSWGFVLPTLLKVSQGDAVSIGLLLNGSQIVTSIVYGIVAYLVLLAWGDAKHKKRVDPSPQPLQETLAAGE